MIRRSMALLLAAAGGCHLVGGIDPAEPQCSVDGIKNGLEVDVDCGGPCARCEDFKACARHEDCASNACYSDEPGDAPLCHPPSCDDDRKNAFETDADCGGDGSELCPRCWGGQGCAMDDDCASFTCEGGRCASACCYYDCADECDDCPDACPPKHLGQPCDDAFPDACDYPLECMEGEDSSATFCF